MCLQSRATSRTHAPINMTKRGIEVAVAFLTIASRIKCLVRRSLSHDGPIRDAAAETCRKRDSVEAACKYGFYADSSDGTDPTGLCKPWRIA